MPTSLEQIWRKHLTPLVTNLAIGSREYEEIANLARHIRADYAGRFLIELIQNANDQALLAKMQDTTVVIVRTDEFVCVTNCGVPFNDRGIDGITSLGVSGKDAEIMIGNKGIGFKAVFEVSNAPEIFSASTLGQSFLSPGGERFRLHENPLEQNGMRELLKDLANKILKDRLADAQGIHDKCHADPVDVVMEAIEMSAPFRYPIALDSDWLQNRIAELKLPTEALGAQTLVVLPLLRNADNRVDARVAGVVNSAFTELVGSGGAVTLFLNGVGRIIVDDRVNGIRHVLNRHTPVNARYLPRGSESFEVATGHEMEKNGNAEPEQKKQWLLVRRTIGRSQPGREEDAQREKLALNDAAKNLPNRNWKNIETATVTVAVPVPEIIEGSIGCDGMLCIGLPTKMCTGTPLWIDSHFHGNIPRTEVYWDQPFNEILLEEAVALSADLIECLKSDSSLDRRRLASLALEKSSENSSSEFCKRLYIGPEALAAGPVILSDDGQSFLRAAELALPAFKDQHQLIKIGAISGDIRAYGFILPDYILMEKARDILENLPGFVLPPDVNDGRFLKRLSGSLSLIEQSAVKHRSEGPEFWQPFFEWLIVRFSINLLEDQRILPVGTEDLKKSEQRVFYKPWALVTGPIVTPDGKGEPELSSDNEDEDEIGVLPDNIQRALFFFDESALPMREPGRRNLTNLGRRLVPQKGPGLVREPRSVELINAVVIECLNKISCRDDSTEDPLGVAILTQALNWISKIKPGSEELIQVKRRELLVPAIAAPQNKRGIIWAKPKNLYIGHGWVAPGHDALLSKIHNDNPGTVLISWPKFAELLGLDSSDLNSRDRICQQLFDLGVVDHPAVFSISRLEYAFQLSYGSFVPGPSITPPFSGIEKLWKDYHASIARELPKSDYSGGDYNFDNVSWVHGLEDPSARAATFELMLENPGYYEKYETSVVSRRGREEKFNVKSFWLWALCTCQWPVVPTTNNDLTSPEDVWQLEGDQRQDRARYSLLSSVPARFDSARQLLEKIGVYTLANSPKTRLTKAIHDLAAQLPVAGDTRIARALAGDLYWRLAEKDTDQDDQQCLLGSRPIPVLKGNNLIAADTKNIRLYIDDDPIRRSFLSDLSQLYFIPIISDATEAKIASLFIRVFGQDSVILTSKAEIETGFYASQSPEDSELLLDYLEKVFPNITVDLGLLIAFGGRKRQAPTKTEFQGDWKRFQSVRLVRGIFGQGFPGSAFYDAPKNRSPELQVEKMLTAKEILEQAWRVFGIGLQDVWTVYASKSPEQLHAFFLDHRISETERYEIERVLGKGIQLQIQPLQPFFFALWRKIRPVEPVETFFKEWEQYSDKASTLTSWLNQPALESVIPSLIQENPDISIIKLVELVSLDWKQWHAGLVELGKSWEFKTARDEFVKLRHELWAYLASSAVRLATINLDEAEIYLISLKAVEPAANLIDYPADEITLIKYLVEIVLREIDVNGFTSTHSRIIDRLNRIQEAGMQIEWISRELNKREFFEFLNNSADERLANAVDASKNYFDLIRNISSDFSEDQAIALIVNDERLRRTYEGYFASQFAFLPELSACLSKEAPLTYKKLSAATVFDRVQRRDELQQICPAMAGPDLKPLAKPLPRQIFGVTIESDKILADLSNGLGGIIGSTLKNAATKLVGLNLNELRTQPRPIAPEPPKRNAPDEKRPPKKPRMPNTQERELYGLLGEVFVYELFWGKKIPGFDKSAWVSENAVRYGFKDTEIEGCGADFHFFDQDGVLSGVPNMECFVEVKSTIGNGSGPFSISFNEWSRAEICHNKQGTKYLIVRVANVASPDSMPYLFDILEDPVKLRMEGKINLASQDLWVYVGASPKSESTT